VQSLARWFECRIALRSASPPAEPERRRKSVPYPVDWIGELCTFRQNDLFNNLTTNGLRFADQHSQPTHTLWRPAQMSNPKLLLQILSLQAAYF